MNRKNRINIKSLIFIIFILMFSFFITEAHAIGITPSRVVLDFEPNLKKNLSFTVIGDPNRAINVEIYVSGDLAKYVTLHEKTGTIPASGAKVFTYELNLPALIEKPGIHDIRIGAREATGSGGMIGARAAVEAQLWIKVPYTGKYAEISLDAPNVKAGEKVDFTVKVSNLGKEDITAEDEIDIYNSEGKKITTLHTGSVNIKIKDSGKLYAKLETKDIKPGKYKAVATVKYDGKSAKAEKEFKIGSLHIEIVDIKVTPTTKGSIAKFEIEIESFWNEKIENVYAEIQVMDGEKIIGTAKSESVNLKPWEKKTIPVYFETKNIEDKKYDAKVILHYANKTAEKTSKVRIIKSSASFTFPYINVLMAGLIIYILIMVFLIYKKKEGKKENKVKI